MPFPNHVFRHTPALRGLITPLDESEMRFGQDRFAELDTQAEEEGWPPGWRTEQNFVSFRPAGAFGPHRTLADFDGATAHFQ